jgi:fucose permease
MAATARVAGEASLRTIRGLTYAMFMMFAMTTDSVGVIIPQLIREYSLSMTAAGAFHYANMVAIGAAGALLGFLADRLGRKRTVMLGLALFAANAFAFPFVHAFGGFLALVAVSGVAIGIFKSGALALIGDISRSTREHTTTMNAVEGFFGVGAIVGPALVAKLLGAGLAWQWLYAAAGALAVVLVLVASRVSYPAGTGARTAPASVREAARLAGDGYALAFAAGAFLYVAVECAIYVWMPTLLADYAGPWRAYVGYAIPAFFVLRAAGRFAGAWLLARADWTRVLSLASLGILGCFGASLAGGLAVAVWALPASGLFMSVIYPTLNSKGISGFPKAQHGAVAGFLLFFTCAGAALGPLAMGAVADAYGHPTNGFALATGFAALLCAGLGLNAAFRPAESRLRACDGREYGREAPAGSA